MKNSLNKTSLSFCTSDKLKTATSSRVKYSTHWSLLRAEAFREHMDYENSRIGLRVF